MQSRKSVVLAVVPVGMLNAAVTDAHKKVGCGALCRRTRRGGIVKDRSFLRTILLMTVLTQMSFGEFELNKFNFGCGYDGRSNFSGLDYTTKWLGGGGGGLAAWGHDDFLRSCKNGAASGVTPVFYAYVIAFMCKDALGVVDCNMSDGNNTLCHKGAGYIRNNRSWILSRYETYARETASIWGTTKPVIWLLEPDLHQYTEDSQEGGGLSYEYMASLQSDIIAGIRKHLPNAWISMDISAWVPQEPWLSKFDMSELTFMNTSGGGSHAENVKIDPPWNPTTWAQVHQLSGKPIIADAGYGVGGGSTGHDDEWDKAINLNARIADGVIAVSQANPRSDWPSIIASLRPQLDPVVGDDPVTDTYTLSTRVSGTGSVNKSPSKSEYDKGATVTLTAVPGNGFDFSHWSDGYSGSQNPATVTMNSNLSITANFSKQGTTEGSEEMITNGDFSNGANGWENLGTYNGASAGGSVVGGEYRIQISNGGSVDWNVQFTQTGLNIQKGESYTLLFDAYSNTSRSLVFGVGMNGGAYTAYMADGSSPTQLGTSKKSYSFTFTMMENTDSDARVEFNCGAAGGDVILDNISLKTVSTSVSGGNMRPAHKSYADIFAATAKGGSVRIEMRQSVSRGTFELYSQNGALLDRRRISATENSVITLSCEEPLSSGIYLLRLRTDSYSSVVGILAVR